MKETSRTAKKMGFGLGGTEMVGRRMKKWKEGKQDGLLTIWYENGQKKLVGNYKDGKPHGSFVSYNEDGREESRKIYKDGELVED